MGTCETVLLHAQRPANSSQIHPCHLSAAPGHCPARSCGLDPRAESAAGRSLTAPDTSPRQREIAQFLAAGETRPGRGERVAEIRRAPRSVRAEQLPVPFGDDLNGAVDHFYGITSVFNATRHAPSRGCHLQLIRMLQCQLSVPRTMVR
jgi:hypothetical protein